MILNPEIESKLNNLLTYQEITRNIYCNICNEIFRYGETYYNCLECYDYDLCIECKNNKLKNNHHKLSHRLRKINKIPLPKDNTYCDIIKDGKQHGFGKGGKIIDCHKSYKAYYCWDCQKYICQDCCPKNLSCPFTQENTFCQDKLVQYTHKPYPKFDELYENEENNSIIKLIKCNNIFYNTHFADDPDDPNGSHAPFDYDLMINQNKYNVEDDFDYMIMNGKYKGHVMIQKLWLKILGNNTIQDTKGYHPILIDSFFDYIARC